MIGRGFGLAQESPEWNGLGGHCLLDVALRVRAEKDSVTAADHGFPLPVGIISETEARTDVHPAIGFIGIVRIPPRPEMKLVIEQSIEIIELGRILRVERRDDRVRVEVISGADIQSKLRMHAPVVLREESERMRIAVVRR